MNKYAAATLVALPVIAAGGFLYGQKDAKPSDGKQVTVGGYVCPLTGETLPCEKCCELNK